MKFIFLSILIPISSTSLTAQQLPTWYRVYTFDESIIEMNTSLVTFISKDISRVRFRWTLDQPAALNGEPKLKYKSRLEVFEFNCSLQRYRPYHLTFVDATGNIVRLEEMNPPAEWRHVVSGSMMAKLYGPACELVKRITRLPNAVDNAIELEKAAKYAFSFAQSLQQAKDFKPLIKNFFADDYLNGYLEDQYTNSFWNLDREVAAKASRAELQRDSMLRY